MTVVTQDYEMQTMKRLIIMLFEMFLNSNKLFELLDTSFSEDELVSAYNILIRYTNELGITDNFFTIFSTYNKFRSVKNQQ